MRFFDILSNDPFVRFQKAVEVLRALTSKAAQEMKSKEFKKVEIEFKKIQRTIDKTLGETTIAHLLEEEIDLIEHLSPSEEKIAAEENLSKAQKAIEGMVSLIPTLITALQKIEAEPGHVLVNTFKNYQTLQKWVSLFQELVETLRTLARVEEELFRKAEKVGIKTTDSLGSSNRFKGTPVAYLSKEHRMMNFVVKGTPKQLLYI